MIEISNYRARLIDLEDLDFLNNIRLSSHVQNNVGTHLFTNNFLQKNWLENISKSAKEKYLILEFFDDKNLNYVKNSVQKIGLIRFTEIDFINRSICVGGDISADFIGQGHGTKMYEIIFKICFDIWGMNRVWLSVLENNHRAINLYKKVGFIQEGVMRSAIFKDGKFENYILMSILKGDR
jgi:RimJ/RimL family protein N-acetyltransferase